VIVCIRTASSIAFTLFLYLLIHSFLSFSLSLSIPLSVMYLDHISIFVRHVGRKLRYVHNQSSEVLIGKFLMPFFSNYFHFFSYLHRITNSWKKTTKREREREKRVVRYRGCDDHIIRCTTVVVACRCLSCFLVYIYRKGRIRWCALHRALLLLSVFLLFLLGLFFSLDINVCARTNQSPFVYLFPSYFSMVAHTGNSTMTTATSTNPPTNNYLSSTFKMNLPQNLRMLL